MLANFLIGLREGLEATLVVSILIAYLVKTDRRDRLPPVWLGIGAAIALSLGIGAVLTFSAQSMSFEAQEGFGGTMSFIAVIFVTFMIFWMRKAARSMKSELQGRLDKAISMGTGALVATAFVSVAREGIETALFVWPAVQAAGSGWEPLAGVFLGLAVAVTIGYLMYRRAIAFNLGRFFTWTGAALVIVAGGVLAYGIAEFQEIGLLPGENSIAFDVSGVIAPDGFVAALLRGILNIHPTTSWLQAIAWLLYVGTVMVFFLRPQRVTAPREADRTHAPVATS
ncbi:MAG TPA: iron uptake transporter permease EfeU [Kineosporiaceae bacterium]|nr:iron uptake transporter permease EfeU [Kineosporiaceae bacterium]